MLHGMWKWQKRVLPFTVLVVLLFIIGHAGAQTEGETATAPDGAEGDRMAAAPPDGPEVNAQVQYVDTDPSAVTLWRPELEPYGVWLEDPVYGLVWIPDENVVGPDFVPYMSAGHWGYTEDGAWLWVSDYEWGWVAFHYGRWVWIPERGWAWIPGRTYAPAWVVWRVGHPGYDYVGWAPMPPTYYWYGGVAVSFWVVPPPYYVYCESRHVFAHDVHHHALHGHHARRAGRYTAPYVPARPGSSRGRHAARPSPGPTPDEARVPADAVPRTPAKPHPRAAAAASPSRGITRPSSRAASMRPVATRPASSIRGVSQPIYRGRPARDLPASRRAAPLARRPDVRRSSPSAAPSRGSRTIGRSSTPSRITRDRGVAPSRRSGVAPRATPRPAARPSGRSSRPGYAPYPTTRPTPRPKAGSSRSSRPSAPVYRQPSSRPSYSPTPTTRPRPSYGSPSRAPVYRAPASRPSRPSKGYKSNDNDNDNNSRKSRGRTPSRARRR